MERILGRRVAGARARRGKRDLGLWRRTGLGEEGGRELGLGWQEERKRARARMEERELGLGWKREGELGLDWKEERVRARAWMRERELGLGWKREGELGLDWKEERVRTRARGFRSWLERTQE